jgi:hypothetical protein
VSHDSKSLSQHAVVILQMLHHFRARNQIEATIGVWQGLVIQVDLRTADSPSLESIVVEITSSGLHVQDSGQFADQPSPACSNVEMQTRGWEAPLHYASNRKVDVFRAHQVDRVTRMEKVPVRKSTGAPALRTQAAVEKIEELNRGVHPRGARSSLAITEGPVVVAFRRAVLAPRLRAASRNGENDRNGGEIRDGIQRAHRVACSTDCFDTNRETLREAVAIALRVDVLGATEAETRQSGCGKVTFVIRSSPAQAPPDSSNGPDVRDRYRRANPVHRAQASRPTSARRYVTSSACSGILSLRSASCTFLTGMYFLESFIPPNRRKLDVSSG